MLWHYRGGHATKGPGDGVNSGRDEFEVSLIGVAASSFCICPFSDDVLLSLALAFFEFVTSYFRRKILQLCSPFSSENC
uniref:Uncharacterized protein n=1 Tax=Solanum lycopersicum TaxID=4081 RepID=A0A3Q7GSR2_SOLLC